MRAKQKGRGPARIVYHITEVGQEAWRVASLEALATPSMTSASFLLGLDNLDKLDPREALDSRHTYQQNLVPSRQSFAEHVEGNEPMHFDMRGFFDYMISMFSAEIDWLEQFINEMKRFKNIKEIKNG